MPQDRYLNSYALTVLEKKKVRAMNWIFQNQADAEISLSNVVTNDGKYGMEIQSFIRIAKEIYQSIKR